MFENICDEQAAKRHFAVSRFEGLICKITTWNCCDSSDNEALICIALAISLPVGALLLLHPIPANLGESRFARGVRLCLPSGSVPRRLASCYLPSVISGEYIISA